MKYACILFFAISLFADDTVEVVNCQNGTFGQISIVELPNVLLQGTSAFLRQSQCDSSVAVSRVAPGTCNVTFAGSVGSATEPVTTPSSTTPVMSYLDAGPSIVVSGPNGDLRLARSINGGVTSYSFVNSSRPPQFLVAGRYEVKSEQGRDIPAMNVGFDYSPIVITEPLLNSPLSSANLPTIKWTGGSESMRQDLEVQVRAATRDGRRAFDVRCRLGAASSAGEYTVPKETWEQVPADVRAAGLASVVISHSGLVTNLNVEGLPGGIQVYLVQFPGVAIQLVP